MDLLQAAKDYATPTVIVGVFGYILHDVWTGYKEFKRDAYNKIHGKVDKTDCKNVMDAHRTEGHHKEAT